MNPEYMRTISVDLTGTDYDNDVYTVPSGKTFLCFKKQVTAGSGTVTVKDTDYDALAVITASSPDSTKELFRAGSVIYASQSTAGNTVALIGILLDANGAPVAPAGAGEFEWGVTEPLTLSWETVEPINPITLTWNRSEEYYEGDYSGEVYLFKWDDTYELRCFDPSISRYLSTEMNVIGTNTWYANGNLSGTTENITISL